MDDHLAKQLVRQLKIINFWISFYGVIITIIMAVVLYFIVQMVLFVQDTNKRIEQLRADTANSLNVQKKTCEAENSVTSWLKANTDVCK